MYYPDRDPYNKGGVNRGYNYEYPGEPRGRDDAFHRSSRRRDDRHASARRPTRVSHEQGDRYKPGPDRDHVSNDYMSEVRRYILCVY